jgi:hypothetical protein
MLAGLKFMCLKCTAVRSRLFSFIHTSRPAPKSAFDLGILQQDEAVRHTGDIVGHHASQPFILYLFEVADGQFLGIVDPMIEERGDNLFGLFMLRFERTAGVERVVEIALLLQTLGLDLWREARQPLRMPANIGETFSSDRQRIPGRGLHQIVGKDVLHQLQRLIEEEFFIHSGVLSLDLRVAAAENIDMLADVADLEQPRLHAIVEIRREIRNLVGEIDQLCLERRPLVQEIFGEFRMVFDVVITRMFDDAFTYAKRQVEPAMCGVTLLEVLDDAQRVEVVVEATPVAGKAAVQRALPGVPKGRMTYIVNQRKRLRQIFVQAKRGRNGPGDLRNLDRVGQAAAKMIGGAAGKYLGLARETPEGTGLHDALAIALERRARGTERRGIDAGLQKIACISGDRASMEIDCHSQI